MEQAREWARKGREHGNKHDFESSFRCFCAAVESAPCWSVPYVLCGKIFIQENLIHQAEDMFAIARVLSTLSGTPMKPQLYHTLRSAEETCRGKVANNLIDISPSPHDSYPSTFHLTFSPEVYADDKVQYQEFLYLQEPCIVTGERTAATITHHIIPCMYLTPPPPPLIYNRKAGWWKLLFGFCDWHRLWQDTFS